MGRSTTFDRDDVVRAARDVFWARGYGEAGIAELEEATGVKRSSLYHAFGSKKGLFAAVASAYLDDVVRTRIDPLRRADAGPAALADYIREMREAISAGPSGCLLLNAACAPLSTTIRTCGISSSRTRTNCAPRSGRASRSRGRTCLRHPAQPCRRSVRRS